MYITELTLELILEMLLVKALLKSSETGRAKTMNNRGTVLGEILISNKQLNA